MSEIKYFTVEEWDNDYNAFCQTYVLGAESHEDARKIAMECSGSDYDYMVRDEVSSCVAENLPELKH